MDSEELKALVRRLYEKFHKSQCAINFNLLNSILQPSHADKLPLWGTPECDAALSALYYSNHKTLIDNASRL